MHVCRTVRSSAALALGKLSALSTRVDPLVGDLLTSLQVMIVVLNYPLCWSEASLYNWCKI